MNPINYHHREYCEYRYWANQNISHQLVVYDCLFFRNIDIVTIIPYYHFFIKIPIDILLLHIIFRIKY